SEKAGMTVAEAAGRALKKTVLELGGSDPFVVLADADLDTAATVACRARNQNNGQSCIAAKRFIVEESVADQFESRFAGAVAALIRVKDAEDALRVANGTGFGLGSNIWTSGVERGKKLAEKVEAGLVFINGMVASDARLPFGGVKRSGYGRELSEYGIKEFTNIQTVWVGPAKVDGAKASPPPRVE